MHLIIKKTKNYDFPFENNTKSTKLQPVGESENRRGEIRKTD